MSRRVGLWRRGSVGEFLKESRTAIEPPTALRRARQSCRSRFPETGRTMRCSSISAILLHEPLDNGGGLLRVLSQSRAEALVNGLPNAGAHCGITEHTARGAFEFRILQLHRHDGCQALANQLGAEIGVRRRQQPPLPRVCREGSRHSLVEANLGTRMRERTGATAGYRRAARR